MIFTERQITVHKGKSSINEPVILYRGDYEVSIKFTIMESKFRFKSGVNLVDSEKASHGQLAILAPYGGNVFSEIVKCEDGTVTFTLTKEMIDQLEEVGLYSFQIRLFDYYRESRVSIPPVEFGIEVREPVASEDHDNKVNNAIVGYSIAKVVYPSKEDVPDTFDANGNYNKTDWETGDRISEGKLNKIEDALDKINQNEKNTYKELDKRATSNFNVLNSVIDNVSNTKADESALLQLKEQFNSILVDNADGAKDNELIALRTNNVGATYSAANVRIDKIENDLTHLKYGANLFDGRTLYGNISDTTGEHINASLTTRLCTDFIEVIPGEEIYSNIGVKASLDHTRFMFYDSKYLYVTTRRSTNGKTIVPDNVKYVRTNIRSDSPSSSFAVDTSVVFIGYTKDPYAIEDKVASINNDIFGGKVDVFVDKKEMPGNINSKNGAITNVEDEGRTSTDFIDLKRAKVIYSNLINLQGLDSQTFIFYDENKTYVSTVITNKNYCDVPVTAKYLKMNINAPSIPLNVSIKDIDIYYMTDGLVPDMSQIQNELSKYEYIEYYNSDWEKLAEKNVFHVNDFVSVDLTDSEIIERCFEFANLFTHKKIIFDTKQWNIDRAILLPANTYIQIDGVVIKQNDNVFDNVFRGDNLTINKNEPNGYPAHISNSKNIKIEMINGASIEGPNVNPTMVHPVTLETQSMVGDYYGWRTLQISFSKIKNFEICGGGFTKTRCWAMSFDKCSNFKVHDFTVNSNVKNGDGVDIRFGCHDFEVYNIDGSTSDDTVAMSSIDYFKTGLDTYVYPMEPSAFENVDIDTDSLDIHNGSVHDITTGGNHHGVICLSNSGRQVYNIYIYNIKEISASTRESVVKIYTSYGGGYINNDIHDIRVNNVVSKGANYAVQIKNAKVQNVWINNAVQERANSSVSDITNPDGVTLTNS